MGDGLKCRRPTHLNCRTRTKCGHANLTNDVSSFDARACVLRCARVWRRGAYRACECDTRKTWTGYRRLESDRQPCESRRSAATVRADQGTRVADGTLEGGRRCNTF